MALQAQIYTAEGKMDKCMVSSGLEARSFIALDKTGGHGIADGLDFIVSTNSLTINKGSCYIFGYYIEIPVSTYVAIVKTPNNVVNWYIELNLGKTNTSTGKIEDGTYKVTNNQVSIVYDTTELPLESGKIRRLYLGKHKISSDGTTISFDGLGARTYNQSLEVSSLFRRSVSTLIGTEVQVDRNSMMYINTSLTALKAIDRDDIVFTLPEPYVADFNWYDYLSSTGSGPTRNITYMQSNNKYVKVKMTDGDNKVLFESDTDGYSLTSGTRLPLVIQIPVRIRGLYSDAN